MAISSERIKKYDVSYYAGGKNPGYEYRAIIGLRRDDASHIGGAYFHRDTATMPDKDNQTPDGFIWCHYTWEDFPQVLDILRNESPVYLRYVSGCDGGISSITTSNEPVGEGEIP